MCGVLAPASCRRSATNTEALVASSQDPHNRFKRARFENLLYGVNSRAKLRLERWWTTFSIEDGSLRWLLFLLRLHRITGNGRWASDSA